MIKEYGLPFFIYFNKLLKLKMLDKFSNTDSLHFGVCSSGCGLRVMMNFIKESQYTELKLSYIF